MDDFKQQFGRLLVSYKNDQKRQIDCNTIRHFKSINLVFKLYLTIIYTNFQFICIKISLKSKMKKCFIDSNYSEFENEF